MTKYEHDLIRQTLNILHRLVPCDEPHASYSEPRRDPVVVFAKHYLQRSPASDLSTAELYQFYREIAATGELEPLAEAQFLRKLTGVMAAVFDARKSHAIRRGDKTVRGFRGVSIREQAVPVEHLVLDE